MSTEKQTLITKYEREIKALKELHNQRENEMKTEHETKISDLSQQHKSELETLRRRLEDDFNSTKQVITIFYRN